MKEKYSKWMFIVFPALAMMLGWGLRGHIGGGPFGAMIPGAMVALCLGLLLELPVSAISTLLVFAIFGIGLGGEMTYGQTLGFLKSPETVWWGTAGTTVKGAVWGLLGGAVFALGFFFRQIPPKTLIVAFVLIMLGMIVGFKLINDPMIIYFSDPNKPRAESWAALLFGAIFMLIYLKLKINSNDFKVISRFSILGMIGGGLGFGFGGFWLVLGSHLPDVIFKSWWKAMEFSFGLILGGFLGYAGWINRKEIALQNSKENESSPVEKYPVWKELGVVLVTGLLVFWLIPKATEIFAATTIVNNMSGGTVKDEIARMAVNYSFIGFLFVLAAIRFSKVAWQIGITLTFCHAAIDLFSGYYPDTNTLSPFTMHFIWVLLMTATVALLVALFSRKGNTVRNMFLLLIWSCITVSFLRMGINPSDLNIENLSVCEIICGRFFVDIFFVVSAIAVSWMLVVKFKRVEN